jgi:hypothetical protein
LLSILDSARWAPSVENLQFWRFKILNETSFDIIVKYQPAILSVGGECGLLHSIGCLLETISISASQYHLMMNWDFYKISSNDYRIHIELKSANDLKPDDLYQMIKVRSVNRKSYKKKLLPSETRQALIETLQAPYHVAIQGSMNEKLKFASIAIKTSAVR